MKQHAKSQANTKNTTGVPDLDATAVRERIRNAGRSVDDAVRIPNWPELEHTLDCQFCGMRCDAIFGPESGGFNSFNKLAQHILFCPWAPLPRSWAWADVEAARRLALARIDDAKMEGRTLSKAYLPPAPQDTREDLPGWIGAKDLGKLETMHVVVIQGVQEIPPSDFDNKTERFGLVILFKKQKRVLPVPLNSVNHHILTDLFGKPKGWKGKKITICARASKNPKYRPFVAIQRS